MLLSTGAAPRAAGQQGARMSPSTTPRHQGPGGKTLFMTGSLLVLLGLALAGGGLRLASLGGSLYYLIAGVGIVTTGVLLLLRKRAALSVYAVVLLATTLWAVAEVRFDWWQLVPRISLWFAIGLLLVT